MAPEVHIRNSNCKWFSCLLVSLLAYFSISVAAADSNDQSVKNIVDRGQLIVGLDIPYGVMEFYDKEGLLAGIDVDIAKEISKGLGVKVKFESMPFAKLFDALKNEQVDLLLSAVTITQERQKSMRFSAPYMDVGLSLATADYNSGISALSDLKGKSVGVLKGTTGEQFARDQLDEEVTDIQVFSNNAVRLSALREGMVDAAIVHFLTSDIPGIKIVGKPLTQSYYGVVSRLDDEALMAQVNLTVRELKRNGKLAKIIGSYTN